MFWRFLRTLFAIDDARDLLVNVLADLGIGGALGLLTSSWWVFLLAAAAGVWPVSRLLVKIRGPAITSVYDGRGCCYEAVVMPDGPGGRKVSGDLYRLRVTSLRDYSIDGVRVRLYAVTPNIDHGLPYPLQRMGDRAPFSDSMRGITIAPHSEECFTIVSRERGADRLMISFGDHLHPLPVGEYRLTLRTESHSTTREHIFRVWGEGDGLRFEEITPVAR